MNDSTTTMAQLRDMMRDFVQQREWQNYHTPRNLAVSAAVEAGELLELFQWDDAYPAAASNHERVQLHRQRVGEELADVLMYLMSLANAMNLDVAAAVQAKMQKNNEKYPADKVRGYYERPVPS